MSGNAQDKIERAYHGLSMTPPYPLLPAPKVAGALPKPPRPAKRAGSTTKFRRPDVGSTRATDSRQAGQAIVLLALAMIALLAFTALAIDGGQVYWLRRSAQNAADGAAMAAAYAKCTGGDIEEAGRAAAALNDFDEAERPGTTVEINSPPTSGPLAGNPAYVEAIVTADTPSHLAHFVYEGPLAVTARAIGYCEPVWDGTTGSAIYAGDTGTCQNALSMSPTTGTIIGGIHSNKDIHVGGNVTTVDGSVSYVTGIDHPGKITFDDEDGDGDSGGFNPLASAPVWSSGTYPVNFQTEDYAPGGVAALAAEADDPDGDGIGRYHYIEGNLKVSSSQNWTGDGLYYVTGYVQISGGAAGEVTIVARETIELSGSSNHDLVPYMDGLLLFSDEEFGSGSKCSKPVIKLSGSNHDWSGIIYAPNGLIQMSGASNSSLHGTLIGYTVNLSGNELYIEYSDEYLPAENPFVEHVE
jgi:hypothetical protein